MLAQTNPDKLLYGGICGLVGGLFFLWLTVDGLFRNEAMTFSRHLAWFHQQDRPAEFVASVLLHISMSLAAIALSLGAIGRYFYFFYPPNRLASSALLGFLAATTILFFAKLSFFAIVAYPLLMLLGFPISVVLCQFWPPALTGGFLPVANSGQLTVALSYISGFLAWWLLIAYLVNRWLRRLDQ